MLVSAGKWVIGDIQLTIEIQRGAVIRTVEARLFISYFAHLYSTGWCVFHKAETAE